MSISFWGDGTSFSSVDMLASGATASISTVGADTSSFLPIGGGVTFGSTGGGTVSPGGTVFTPATGGGTPLFTPPTGGGTPTVFTLPTGGGTVSPGGTVFTPPTGGGTTTVSSTDTATSAKPVEGAEKIVKSTSTTDSSAAQSIKLPKWVAPVGIAVLVLVAAYAAYKLWFTAQAAA